ncbi:MAG: hypothetical protein F4X99_00205 [Gammaproteobacteria bacterium]|nr:hypothetical protein [Gammaproteobacteria bacterium]
MQSSTTPEDLAVAAPDGAPATARRQGESAWDRDLRLWTERKPPLTRYLQHAVANSGRSPFSLAREYIGLSRGRGRLTLQEYVQYGVYDPSLGDDERSRFLTEKLHWPIVRRCNDIAWQAATEDKWLCAQLLERAGLPQPPILAMIDTTERTFPGTRTIRSDREFGEFVRGSCRDGTALFCKPSHGLASYGAFVVDGAERDRLHVEGEGWMAYDACFAELIGGHCYVVQPMQRNHPSLARYTERLATVRVYVLRTDSGVKLPFAALKMAAPEHVADNYWRPGNLACDVDPITGSIRSARTKDAFGTTDHLEHPHTGARLVGERVPRWEDIVALTLECSSIFAPVRYHSLDVAILAEGLSIIEVNTGGAFNIPQLAAGRGFLTDQVLDLFRACGFKG